MKITKILNKVCVSSLSLLMLSSLGTGVASAKHVHHSYHSHKRVVRVLHHKRNRNRDKLNRLNRDRLNRDKWNRDNKNKLNPKQFKHLLITLNKARLSDKASHWVKHNFYQIIPKLSNNQIIKVHEYFNILASKGLYNEDKDADPSTMFEMSIRQPQDSISVLNDFENISKPAYKRYMHRLHQINLTKSDPYFMGNTIHLNKYAKQDNQFDDAVRLNLFKDINQARVRYGRKPLIMSTPLQRCADYRAPRVTYAYNHLAQGRQVAKQAEHVDDNYINQHGGSTDGWIHGSDLHQDGITYLDGHQYGVAHWSATASDNSFKVDGNADNTRLKYNNKTPQGMAANMVDGYLNHDWNDGNFNSHRKSLLNPQFKYIGIATNNLNHYNSWGSDNEQLGA